MEITAILLIAGIIILAVLGFKIIKTAMKTLIYVLGIMVIGLIIFGFIAYSDVKTLNENMEQQKVIVYDNGNSLVAGVSLQGKNLLSKEQDLIRGTKTLSDSELRTIEEEISQGKRKALTIKINEGALGDEGIKSSKFNMTKDEFEDSIRTEQDERIKSLLFLSALSTTIKEEGSSSLITGIKEGNIEIYPDLISIKLIKDLPGWLHTRLIKESVQLLPTEKED